MGAHSVASDVDIRASEKLNGDYMKSVETSDVRWFEDHLAEDFLNSNPDGSLVGRSDLERGPDRQHAHEGAGVRSLPRERVIDGNEHAPRDQCDTERRRDVPAPGDVLFDCHQRPEQEHPTHTARSDREHQ